MSKIVPFNNIVLAEFLEDNKKQGSIILPDSKIGRFAKLKIIEIGELVTWLKRGDIVFANPVLEIIDPIEPKLGFINSKDILAKIEE